MRAGLGPAAPDRFAVHQPGGPGTSAVQIVRTLGRSIYSPALRARFDIVGMDPRGIGGGTPVRCYDASEQSAQAAVLLKSAPSDPGQFAQRVTAARDFATRCVQRNGDLLEHCPPRTSRGISTRSAKRWVTGR